MAISKSAKIEAEIEKVKAKISEQQARLKELERKAGGGKQRDRGHRAGMSIPLPSCPWCSSRSGGATFGTNVPGSPRGGV